MILSKNGKVLFCPHRVATGTKVIKGKAELQPGFSESMALHANQVHQIYALTGYRKGARREQRFSETLQKKRRLSE